jgi:hypothetical protein
MPLVVTHVSARLSENRATRFRRLAPVIITVWTPEELAYPPQDVRECLELLKRRIMRVCFEAYHQNGLLTLMDLQWVFQLPAVRISELIRSVQREHNLVVPTPGTILDTGRSMTHKDVIVGLHLEGYTVKEIARMAELVAEYGRNKVINLAVVHGGAEEECRGLLEKIKSIKDVKIKEIFFGQIGPVLVVHTGPGLIGLAFYEA